MALFKKALIFLTLITLIGAFLRFYRLSDSPPSLNWDEVSHAFNAYSLLHTGRDQWGQVLPITNFRAYGDYPTTLNLYLTVPAIAIMGPTDFAVRSVHALIGVLTIVSLFLAGYFWKKDIYVAILTAMLVAGEPWLLFTSRTVLQANVAVLFLSLAAATFFRRRSVWLFGLSLFGYHNTRIFVPVLAAGMTVVSLKSKQYLKWLALVVVGVVILLFPQVRSRSGWVGILNRGSVAYLEQARSLSPWPPVVSRLVYNRPVYFLSQMAKNYVDYFSPQFLFAHGGTQYQFSLPGHGVLYWINLPFFYLGMTLATMSSPFVLWWLLVSPLAAAVTVDRFAVVRATTMIPVVYLVTASGLVWLIRKLKGSLRYAVILIYGLIYVASLSLYLRNYYSSYPGLYSQSWQYGYKQAAEYIKEHYSDYDQIIFTKKYGEPHEFLAFYWPWDPADYQKNNIWDFHANWYWVNQLDKIKFVNDWEMKSVVLKSKTLTISSPENETTGREIKRINFLDGKTTFIIKEI